MPAVQRQGDPNVRGGVVSSGDASVRINGVPVAVKGSPITPYNIGKNRINAVANGSSSVRVNGRPMVTAGSTDSAGTPLSGGSPNVNAA